MKRCNQIKTICLIALGFQTSFTCQKQTQPIPIEPVKKDATESELLLQNLQAVSRLLELSRKSQETPETNSTPKKEETGNKKQNIYKTLSPIPAIHPFPETLNTGSR